MLHLEYLSRASYLHRTNSFLIYERPLPSTSPTTLSISMIIVNRTNANDQQTSVRSRAFFCWIWGWISLSIKFVSLRSPTSISSNNTSVPLYQSETAPKWIRGVIVGSYQLAITIGLLLAAIVNNATSKRNDTGSYRIPIAVQFAWAIILVTGMLILPETPRYLIRSGKFDKAARSLSRLRRLPVDHDAIQLELDEIQANHEYELSLGKASYLDCFRGKILKRQLTGCGLQALQQLTGRSDPRNSLYVTGRVPYSNIFPIFLRSKGVILTPNL